MGAHTRESNRDLILLGGGGFIASHLIDRLAHLNRGIVVVDRQPMPIGFAERVDNWIEADFAEDSVILPDGDVIVCFGPSQIDGQHYRRHYRDSAVGLSRLVGQLAGRNVVLLSTIDVYGLAEGKLTETTPANLPVKDARLNEWSAHLARVGLTTNPDELAESLVRDISETDPSGRWAYAIAKRMQELMLQTAISPDSLRIFRLSNVYGAGQFRILSRFAAKAVRGLDLTATDTTRSFVSTERLADVMLASVERAIPGGIYNLAEEVWHLPRLARVIVAELDSTSGVNVVPPKAHDLARDIDGTAIEGLVPPVASASKVIQFARVVGNGPLQAASPPISVVIPPAPFEPRNVTARIQRCLATGALKHGNVWTTRLEGLLSERLGLSDERVCLVTNSGTSALRMAIYALAGPANPGDVAVLPSFSFPATAEALVQLGYRLRFCDIDARTWTLCPQRLDEALSIGNCRLVVCVDALGCPCGYETLNEVCDRHGVVLIADSAPSLGASYKGRAVGTQASAHAFSMSFAKVVSAGGSGGAVVLPKELVGRISSDANWWRSSQMPEIAAIVALDQLERLDTLVARRNAVARVYQDLEPHVVPQAPEPDVRHAWVHWGALTPERDRLAQRLARIGIGTKPYYAPALHALEWANMADTSIALPVTDDVCSRVLALPMSSEMGEAQAELIAFSVQRLLSADKNVPEERQVSVQS